MTAEEIRKRPLSENSPDWMQVVFLREIAAQLAELNAHLRKISDGDALRVMEIQP